MIEHEQAIAQLRQTMSAPDFAHKLHEIAVALRDEGWDQVSLRGLFEEFLSEVDPVNEVLGDAVRDTLDAICGWVGPKFRLFPTIIN